MSDSKLPKARVNWSIDQEVLAKVQERAKMESERTGLEVSISAAANLMLRERIEQGKITAPAQTKSNAPLTRPAPKPGAKERHYVDDEN